MLSRFKTLAIAVPFAFVLASCDEIYSPLKEAHTVDAEVDEVYGPHPLNLKVGGFSTNREEGPRNVNDFKNAREFRQALTSLAPELCSEEDKLGTCLQRLRNEENDKANGLFQGVAGLTGRTFLRVGQSTIKEGGRFRRANVTIKGQITPYCLHDSKKRGYAYDARNAKMHICVIVKTTIEHPGVNAFTAQKDPETLYQYFHVAARKNVGVDDGAGGSADNAFPKAAAATKLKIPQSLPDSFTPPLTHKLYAWGEAIRVMNYWETTKADANGDPIWDNNQKYARQSNGAPPTNAPQRIKAFFALDPEACIDMLFLGPPPSDLQGYTGGVSYCLGRCDFPPIVNTR
ncbi:hypothetical protein KX928_20590 [Roseobacter sp. YSTF-M11]|uniref:Lipoprotein n=1 Tax=Roseobacter insulae TaxID=2859783 RepID=A0A9X1FZE4_9RHOB|nr:hypothetical protein [Roseobacter insulae]MBW4710192.1 hypothetical protein [Roseobacter insulae]